MKDIKERASEYFDFLWDASSAIIDEYFFKKYPEIGSYVHPRGAASCLLVGAHYAVLKQRDELIGSEGDFDGYAEDADEVDRYVEFAMNDAAASNGLPSDLYQKLVDGIASSVNPDAMWLLADIGGGGKKGRVVAIHSQIGNYLCNSYFRNRGASIAEMGDAGNVLNRLFAACYTKYAETLGFNEADYDETLRVTRKNTFVAGRGHPKVNSLECPENPFVSSLVEHVASAEMTSWGHDAPQPSAICGWAADFFNEYFSANRMRAREVEEEDVRGFANELEGIVQKLVPEVIDRYLKDRENYIWSFGLRKGEMVVSILHEIWGDDRTIESHILALTNNFIDKFIEDCALESEDIYD